MRQVRVIVTLSVEGVDGEGHPKINSGEATGIEESIRAAVEHWRMEEGITDEESELVVREVYSVSVHRDDMY